MSGNLRSSIGKHLLLATFLLPTICFAAAGQTQGQPAEDAPPAAAKAAAAASTSPKDRVILKIGDQQITEAAFEQYIADLEAQQGPADLSRKKLGENYSSMLMLSQRATANHLDQSADVQRQLAIDRMQILSNAEFNRLKEEAKPTPQQIKAYYDAHLDDFDVAYVRRVFIMSSAKPDPGHLTREQAKALADAVRQAYTSGKDPMPIIEATPHAQTDIVADHDPLTFVREELPAPMDKAAFSLKAGEWTQLGQNPDQYVFIQLVKRDRKSLNDVSSQIERKLQAEKLREELDAMKKKTGIWMDEEYFASKAPIPISSTQPEASGQGKSGAERGDK